MIALAHRHEHPDVPLGDFIDGELQQFELWMLWEFVGGACEPLVLHNGVEEDKVTAGPEVLRSELQQS